MTLTPNLKLPYPELSDTADVPRDIHNLAQRLDTFYRTAWLTPSAFLNGWTGNTPAAPVGYLRDASGTVYLRGLLTAGTPSATAFTLPVGFRPSQLDYHAAVGG